MKLLLEKSLESNDSFFYVGFHTKVKDVIGSVGKVSGERELGIDPKSGDKVFARMSLLAQWFRLEKNKRMRMPLNQDLHL